MRIISAFGPPCSLSNWGVDLLRKILECAGEAVEFIYKSDVEGLSEAWRGIKGKACLIYADLPDKRLVELYTRANVPIIVFSEAPLDLVSFLMRERAIPLRDAVATASLFLATFHQFGFRDRTLMVSRKSRSLPGLIEAVLDMFAIDLSADSRVETLRRILEIYGASATVDELVAQHGALGEPSGALGDRLTAEEKAFVEGVLAGYVAGADDAGANRIYWPRELFLLADQPGKHLSRRIELVGGARFLIYGPYLCLPPGEWIASVELEIVENASGNVLLVDTCGGADSRPVKLRLPSAGRFKFSMQVSVSDSRRPIELRAILGESAIEGWINWRGALFSRAPDGAGGEPAENSASAPTPRVGPTAQSGPHEEAAEPV